MILTFVIHLTSNYSNLFNEAKNKLVKQKALELEFMDLVKLAEFV